MVQNNVSNGWRTPASLAFFLPNIADWSFLDMVEVSAAVFVIFIFSSLHNLHSSELRIFIYFTHAVWSLMNATSPLIGFLYWSWIVPMPFLSLVFVLLLIFILCCFLSFLLRFLIACCFLPSFDSLPVQLHICRHCWRRKSLEKIDKISGTFSQYCKTRAGANHILQLFIQVNKLHIQTGMTKIHQNI